MNELDRTDHTVHTYHTDPTDHKYHTDYTDHIDHTDHTDHTDNISPGADVGVEFLHSKGGTHNENDGFGKITSICFHGGTSRRLNFPRRRQKQRRNSSEDVCFIMCVIRYIVASKVAH